MFDNLISLWLARHLKEKTFEECEKWLEKFPPNSECYITVMQKMDAFLMSKMWEESKGNDG
jgi:hypothetical protein